MAMNVLQRGVSTHVAAKEAGVTFRQADYWVREGVIIPSVPARGSGYSREWSPEDVELLRLGGVLSAALGGRVPIPILELAVEQLRELPLTWWPELLDVHVAPDVVVTVRLKPADIG